MAAIVRMHTPSTAPMDRQLVLLQQGFDLVEAIEMARRQQQAQCRHLHARPQIGRDDNVLFTAMRAAGHEHWCVTNSEVVPQQMLFGGAQWREGQIVFDIAGNVDARRLSADSDDAFGIQIWSAC